MTAPTGLRAVGLLERAIGYTRCSLALVSDPLLESPTPCAEWDLRALLEHLDDSLATFVEAGALGQVGAVPVPPPGARLPADLLVDRLRARACAVLGAWSGRDAAHAEPVGPARRVVLDGPTRAALDPSVLAAVGGLEIAVHGWDVARACGADLPIPEALAAELLEVAPDVVGDDDRARRFGPEREAVGGSRSERLLALLGR